MLSGMSAGGTVLNVEAKAAFAFFFVPGGVWRRARPGLMPADGKIKTL